MTEKFGVGSLGLGGLPGVLDTMEMIRKAWTPIGLPPSFAPTMDVGELDKRIADLKAVEQWLNVNLGMLRGTIQGLEVQRGTLAALDAFGHAFGEPGAPAEAAARALAAFATLPQAMAQAQAAAAAAVPPATAAPAGSSTDAAVEAPSDASADTAAGPLRDASGAARSRASSGAPSSDAPTGAAPVDFAAGLSKAAAAAVNPAAWWELLQSQFNQVAQAAIGGGSARDAGKTGATAGSKPGGGRKSAGAGGGAAGPGKTKTARARARVGAGGKPPG